MMVRIVTVVALLIASGFAARTSAQTELQHVEINGHNTAYVDVGAGPAMVLIHGLGADMSRFEKNIDALSRHHRVIALDLLGFGASDKPDIEYSVDVFVEQVAALLNRLGVERATFVGNSMGGWVSLAFAERYPEHTESLVLIAPAFFKGLPAEVSAEALAAGALPQTEHAMRGYLDRVMFRPPTGGDEIKRRFENHLALNRQHVVASIARSIKVEEGIFTDERLTAISQPVLILHGVQDGIVPVESSRELASLVPHAQLKWIDNAGHWPQLEHPEFVSQAILLHSQ